MFKYFFITLLFLSGHVRSQTNELTLYFVPSPLGMDWSSPANITLSALKNRLSLKPRFMGHVFVEFKCDQKHELTGMTSGSFNYLKEILLNQRGLGILYHSFEGRLEEKAEIQSEVNEYLIQGQANFTRFLLNPQQCRRLSRYFNEYKEMKVAGLYGLANRPRYGEGAGCSAFGVSFVDVLNLLDPEMKEAWSQTIKIPLKFSGPPLKDEGVSVLQVILNAHRWADEKEPHQTLTFWDPDRMHRWVKKKVAEKKSSYEILNLGAAKGVVFDKRKFPAPEGPIWLQHLDPLYQK